MKKKVCMIIEHRTDFELDAMTYRDTPWDEFHTPEEVREEMNRRVVKAKEKELEHRVASLEKELDEVYKLLKDKNNV